MSQRLLAGAAYQVWPEGQSALDCEVPPGGAACHIPQAKANKDYSERAQRQAAEAVCGIQVYRGSERGKAYH